MRLIKLELNGFKSFAKKTQIDIERGVTAIIGPNGSGKSTLLKSIYRVLTPQSGTVFLDGNALNSYKPKESARKMAVVAQHNYYNFEFSVQDVVLMGRGPAQKGHGAGQRGRLPDCARSGWKRSIWAALPSAVFPPCPAASSSG